MLTFVYKRMQPNNGTIDQPITIRYYLLALVVIFE